MRPSNRAVTRNTKNLARRKYAERQINKYIKWSIEQRGCLKFKDLDYMYKKYNIKVYG